MDAHLVDVYIFILIIAIFKYDLVYKIVYRCSNMANTELISDDFQAFRANMDGWVKAFSIKMDKVATLPQQIEENANNVNHNYEITMDLIKDIKKLKDELRTIKLMQLFIIKNSMNPELAKKLENEV